MRDAEGEVLAARIFPVARTQRWWLDRTLALRSPLIAAARLSAQPFWCNARGIWARGGRRILPEVDLADFAQRALARCAIVVPVHLPLGQIGIAGIVSPDPGCDDLGETFDACADVLALYASCFVSSYAGMVQTVSRLARAPVLSCREVECLRWAAAGKTNVETGIIVGLSQATVRFHIRNAAAKLDAVNRDHAVFKASQLGYLPASH
ncbi:hypothetical protein ASE49_01375 [Novosphingobium sp. Leaf2]|nr:hypothetical protein ASE49_01375 [Novosphingobium sp. Leaf2]